VDAAKAQVLFDVTLLAFGALVIGLMAFHVLRVKNPQIGWHHHGNVWSAPFDVLDLAAAGVIVLYFLAQSMLPHLLLSGAIPGAPEMSSDGDVAETLNPPMSPSAAILLSTVFNIALGAGVFAYASVLRNRDPVQLFGLNRLRPIGVLAWTAGGLPVIYGFFIVGVLVWTLVFQDAWGGGEEQLQEAVRQLRDTSSIWLRILILVAAMVVAPIVEEVIFRGFLYAVFKRFSDRFFAAVLSALIFSVIHANIPGLFPLFMLGLAFALAYELSGCLWVPIALHAIFNGIQSLIILFFPEISGG